MINSYPELPLVPYEATSVEMHEVISCMQAMDADPEVKRTAYIMFREESANGKKGVNNNYCGMQADSGRWPETLTHYFAGVAAEPENGTGRMRLFLTFARWQDCIACLMDRVKARGLYIGAMAVPISHLQIGSEADLVRAYVKEWARGNRDAEPDADTIAAWRSMYGQAQGLFRHGASVAPRVAPDPDNSSDELNQRQLDQGSNT
jgi:hypothetical protein